MQTQTAPSDLAVLLRLNNDYIESVKTSNVKRFREILADDFLCSLPDGTLIDRTRFLEQSSKPSAIGSLQVDNVNVRLMGDFAIVHARTTFTLPDGTPGSGRYTDVWARRNGQWVAVFRARHAQINSDTIHRGASRHQPLVPEDPHAAALSHDPFCARRCVY